MQVVSLITYILLILFLPKDLLKSPRIVPEIVSSRAWATDTQAAGCTWPLGTGYRCQLRVCFRKSNSKLQCTASQCAILSVSQSGKKRECKGIQNVLCFWKTWTEATDERWAMKQSESCLPVGDVYIERKARGYLFNRREIPSFLPTNSNMIYSWGRGCGAVRGEIRAQNWTYIAGVTDCMIRFAWEVASRAVQPIGFGNVGDTSYKTYDFHNTEKISEPTSYLGCG